MILDVLKLKHEQDYNKLLSVGKMNIMDWNISNLPKVDTNNKDIFLESISNHLDEVINTLKENNQNDRFEITLISINSGGQLEIQYKTVLSLESYIKRKEPDYNDYLKCKSTIKYYEEKYGKE